MGRFDLIDPRHKILRFPDEIATLKQAGIPAVLNVEMDLSESCNARCAGCDFPDHYDGFLSPSVEQATIHRLKLWGTKAVVFTGGGEPTVHPQWQESANRWSKDFQLGMYTNGIKLDLSPCDKAFKWVYVSLDAYDAESWAKYKRVSPDLFHKVLANIEAATYYTTVGVGFLIGEDNYRDVQKMAIAGLATGCSYVHFRPRWPCDDSWWAAEARVLLHGAENMPFVRVAWDKFEAAWKKPWRRSYTTCWASMFLRQVDVKGDVYACPTTRWLRKLGNVVDCPPLTRPLPVTLSCREMCRGHAMNETLDSIMAVGPHDFFV